MLASILGCGRAGERRRREGDAAGEAGSERNGSRWARAPSWRPVQGEREGEGEYNAQNERVIDNNNTSKTRETQKQAPKPKVMAKGVNMSKKTTDRSRSTSCVKALQPRPLASHKHTQHTHRPIPSTAFPPVRQPILASHRVRNEWLCSGVDLLPLPGCPPGFDTHPLLITVPPTARVCVASTLGSPYPPLLTYRAPQQQASKLGAVSLLVLQTPDSLVVQASPASSRPPHTLSPTHTPHSTTTLQT